MPRRSLLLLTLLCLTTGPLRAQAAPDPGAEVRAAEAGFAASMARRDFSAFAAYLSDEARFFGRSGPLRGKDAVLAAWKPWFDGATAPFSWAPEVIEVLPSGSLALSSGPVYGEDGTRIGTFNSIWRRDGDGRWRVIFDKGCPVCTCQQDE